MVIELGFPVFGDLTEMDRILTTELLILVCFKFISLPSRVTRGSNELEFLHSNSPILKEPWKARVETNQKRRLSNLEIRHFFNSIFITLRTEGVTGSLLGFRSGDNASRLALPLRIWDTMSDLILGIDVPWDMCRWRRPAR